MDLKIYFNTGRIFILISFIFLNLILTVNSRKCYQCIRFECSSMSKEDSRVNCKKAQSWAEKAYKIHFETEREIIRLCPPPNDTLAWKELSQTEDNSKDCIKQYRDNNLESTCALGRFRIFTQVMSQNENNNEMEDEFTSLGTFLGCLKTETLKKVGESRAENVCYIEWSNSSKTANYISHNMETEFCSQIEDMCYKADFCIPPRNTFVKDFKINNGQRDDSHYLWAFIIGGIVILTLIGICTFIGIYRNQ